MGGEILIDVALCPLEPHVLCDVALHPYLAFAGIGGPSSGRIIFSLENTRPMGERSDFPTDLIHGRRTAIGQDR